MSDDKPAEPRRTILIGDDADLPPATGVPIDPLLSEGEAAPVVEQPVTETRVTEDGRPVTTILIGDDELPDATYTAQSARSPEDSDHGRPRVDPRMKARRLAVRRAAGRRRFWWLIAGIVVVLLGVAALAVFSSSLFDIQQIDLTGAVNSDQSEIDEITDDLRGKPILTADFHKIEERLEALPWVRYAKVTMDFPHTVHVQISERIPVAAFQSVDGWRVIDVDGRVIHHLIGRPVDYVAIFGDGPDVIEGESAPAAYAKVAQFVTSLPPVLRPLVQQFTLEEHDSVTMTLKLSTAPAGTANANQETQVDFGPADKLNVQQLVALTAFIETKVDRSKTPPARINVTTDGLIATSNS